MSGTRIGRPMAPPRQRGQSGASMTMADQCVASASNFAVGIVVARISGPAGLGAFALAYTVWILVTTMHRSMITDPMAIMGDMRGDEKDEYVRRGFAADVTLGLMAACVIAAVGTALLVVGQHTFGVGLLSVAPWVIMLDLQDYWRWIGFMQGKPQEVPRERPPVQRRPGAGVRDRLPGGSALGVRGGGGLGPGSNGRRSLWSPAILGASVDTRRRGISLVSSAHEPVVGQRACRQLGGQPALSHHCGRHAGPGGTRRFEGCAGTGGRPDDPGGQCRGKFRPARSDKATRRARLGGHGESCQIRNRSGSCRFSRMQYRRLCGCARPSEAPVRSRLRPIRDLPRACSQSPC